ncbi:MAG: hypothetical protein KDA75_11670 [Planctomycetaceae bacterium]|nr:hypothetical protein [Planctomycetaceae bacterium]
MSCPMQSEVDLLATLNRLQQSYAKALARLPVLGDTDQPSVASLERVISDLKGVVTNAASDTKSLGAFWGEAGRASGDWQPSELKRAVEGYRNVLERLLQRVREYESRLSTLQGRLQPQMDSLAKRERFAHTCQRNGP